MTRALIAVSLLALAGCGDRPSADAPDVAQWEDELPISGPWLRERLPAAVVAYARVPHPIGLFAMPKGTMLDAALGSEAHVRSVVAIQQGVRDNVLDTFPVLDDPRFAFVVEQLASPIEIAFLGSPSPSVLIGATLKLSAGAELEAVVGSLAAGGPPVRLAAPPDARGISEIIGLPAQALLKFDEATGELLIAAGPGLTRAWFEQTVEMMAATPEPHAMHPLEAQLDASGQGLFAWVNMQSLLPLAQAFGPPEAVMAIQQGGFGSMRAMAFGIGAANGKGRTTVLVDLGDDTANRALPIVTNTLTATSIGQPNGVFMLSLPSVEEFRRLESLVLETVPPAAAFQWQAAQAQLTGLIGVSLDEALAAVGPDVMAILDEAGDYIAVRLRDPAAFDTLASRIAATFEEPITEHTVNGQTIHRWRPPSMMSARAARAAEAVPAAQGTVAGAQLPLLELFGRMRQSWYWMRDGEYLYFARVPQPLMSRAARGADKAPIGEWLAQSQGVDWSSAQLAATGAIPKLPRRVYYTYLEMMQSIANLAGTEYDLWSMPTAEQLQLPHAGALGVSLNFGQPHVSLELTYETMPGDVLLAGGSAASVAAVGIVAAIAIPAYQDYTTRANVAAGLATANAIRDQVTAHYERTGRFPDPAEASVLEQGVTVPPVEAIWVEPGSGSIILSFSLDSRLAGGEVWLEPEVTANGTLQWSCTGSIDAKYLPAMCR